MISLDQILLLQEKVETAVARISSLTAEVAQLKSENEALRTKCTELTSSLSEKSEFVSSLEINQNQIEQGIMDALSRLDSLEDAVLRHADAEESSSVSVNDIEETIDIIEEPEVTVDEVTEGTEEAPSSNIMDKLTSAIETSLNTDTIIEVTSSEEPVNPASEEIADIF